MTGTISYDDRYAGTVRRAAQLVAGPAIAAAEVFLA